MIFDRITLVCTRSIVGGFYVLALTVIPFPVLAGIAVDTATATATATATPTATDTATATATSTATDTATEVPIATETPTATATATDTATATATDTATATATETATATATATTTDTATVTATATKTPCTGLDVDGNGLVQASTDGVYIFRRMLGLGFVVPPPFRALDPSIPPDPTIVATIDLLAAGLDVDGDGDIFGATDGVYIFRVLLKLGTVVPASFRAVDPTIASDETIRANVAALCGGGS